MSCVDVSRKSRSVFVLAVLVKTEVNNELMKLMKINMINLCDDGDVSVILVLSSCFNLDFNL